ncbi:MAG: hypothetical protein R2939_22210 [Kofleriaceae bacterium]
MRGASAAYGVLARGRVAAAVHAALTAAGASAETVIVDGDPLLARAIAGHGWTVSAVAHGRAARRAPRPIEAVPVGRTATALIGVGAADAAQVAAWAAACVDGGVVVHVDRGGAAAATRAALLARLTELAQRVVGRTHVTSGRVVAYAAVAG